MQTTTIAGVKFSDADIVNMDEFTCADNRCIYDKSRGFLFHDHGFTVAVVFADHLQDALDIAVDDGGNRMNRYLIDHPGNTPGAVPGNTWRDYMTADPEERAAGLDIDCPDAVHDGIKYWWATMPTFLGNASEPYDIESLSVIEFACPPMSVCRLLGDTVEPISVHFA